MLAGFSQGGAIALNAGLRYGASLAGIMALSTYLPMPEQAGAEADDANAATPIFMAHGEYDPVVPMGLAERSRDFLDARHYPIEWHTYPMEHSVSPEQLADIGEWLARVLGQ